MTDIPVTPRLSSTVLLVRDQVALEVLMVKRNYEIDFASGALVFPGGKSNDEDMSPNWADLIDGEFAPQQQGARISAVREAYEESGILLARPASARGAGAPLVGRDMATRLAPHRAAVDRCEISFLELVRQHDLVLSLDALVHFGHWITPVMMPKRFDTHFYLAATPAGQIAEHDGRETTEAVWLEPGHALAMDEAGEATIIFPTRLNLRKLAQARSVKQAMGICAAQAVVTVLPVLGKADDGAPCLHIPEVAGYGQTIELMAQVARTIGKRKSGS